MPTWTCGNQNRRSALLRRESDNPNDHHAVAVHKEGLIIGHVPL